MNTRIFHGRQLRKSRISLAEHVYLITTCCNERNPLFEDVELGKIVVNELRRSDDDGRSRTYAYVVMPDHLHWLFQLGNCNSLQTAMRMVKGHSAYRINKYRGHTGSVWQSGYHDRLVRAEESLEAIGNYIVHNPVRAEIVKNIDDYPLWDILWQRWQPVRG